MKKLTKGHPERMRGIYSILIFFSVLAINIPLFSENSLTLPAGRFRARIKPMYAFDFTTQFGNSGTEESLVSQFQKELTLSLAQKLSPQLAQVMTMTGFKSLGTFDPSLKVSSFVFGSAVEYGVTDELTLGLILPIIAVNTRFDLRFRKTEEASLHPVFKTIAYEQAVRDTAVSKGYENPQNWESFGLGDIEVGVKYKFFNNDLVSVATKTGIRLPTGKPDNPDQLTDIGLGDGQTDIGSTLLLDFKGIPSMLFTAMTKYTIQLPDRQMLRVADDNELFTSNKEEIYRNLGDRVDTALTAELDIFNIFNVNATYAFFSKEKDRFQSTLGYYDKGLEKNTAQSRHSADLGIGFSTLPWFKEGSFSLPMDASVNVEIPLAGRNVANVKTVNLEYKLYF